MWSRWLLATQLTQHINKTSKSSLISHRNARILGFFSRQACSLTLAVMFAQNVISGAERVLYLAKRTARALLRSFSCIAATVAAVQHLINLNSTSLPLISRHLSFTPYLVGDLVALMHFNIAQLVSLLKLVCWCTTYCNNNQFSSAWIPSRFSSAASLTNLFTSTCALFSLSPLSLLGFDGETQYTVGASWDNRKTCQLSEMSVQSRWFYTAVLEINECASTTLNLRDQLIIWEHFLSHFQFRQG